MRAVAAAAAAVAVALFLPLEFPAGEGQAQQQAAFEFEVYAGAPVDDAEITTRRWHSPRKGNSLPEHGGLDWRTANQGDATSL